jgi:ATP-binding cassette, subfamily F, member 3
MLTVSNLSIHFANRYLFDDVTFTIKNQDRIGLIGRNGTGKSTLLKIITGLQTPEDGKIIKSNDYKIGYLPQDGNLESELSVFEEAKKALSEILELEVKIEHFNHLISTRTDYESEEYLNIIHDLSEANDKFRILGGNSAEAKIEKILTGLGFSRDDITRTVNEFSGGWRMRIALAKILLSNPDCVLLDEPTNHLDIESIIWLEQFLRSYEGSVMMVSHDKRFLDTITNRTIEISNAKVIDFELPFSQFMIRRDEIKEQQLNAYKNQQKQIAVTEKYIERFRYKATLASRVQSRIKLLDKVDRIELEDDDNSAFRIKFPIAPSSGRVVVETKNMTKKYGDKLILSNIDFAIEKGEKVAFVGKNGEGKTTLTKVIANEVDYDGICNLGHNVMLGYFSQHQAEQLNPDLTAFQVIDNAAKGEMRTRVRSILGAFLFSGESVDKKVRVLSGGEKSRLALAKLLLQPHNLLILDEPTNHLDMASKEVLKDALNNYSGSLIVVSHDREFLEGLTEKTFYFKDKKIKEYIGGINEFLEKQSMDNLKEVERANILRKLDNDENQQTAKINREEQKRIQREQNKVQKVISSIEEEIANYEAEINELEKQFEVPEFFIKVEEAQIKQDLYNSLRVKLDASLERWSELSEQLENIE